MHHRKSSLIIAAGLLLASTAGASPNGTVLEPRALGMGGTGVAIANGSGAPLLNPALLALPSSRDRFSISLPIGGRAQDPDDLIDAIDDFNAQQPISAFREAVRVYTEVQSASTAAEVATQGEALMQHFSALSNKDLQGEGLAALIISKPGQRLGVSAFARAYLSGGAGARISDADLSLTQDAIDEALSSQTIVDPTGDFTSEVNIRAAGIAEAGLSFATRLEALAGIAVGVSPKYVQVRTYDYGFVGSDLDDVEIEWGEGQRTDSNFNVDVGIAKEWGNGWVTALAAHNLITQEYRTVRNNVVKIKPQARLGIARRGETLTLALDLDLNENEPVGIGSASRYASAGIELNLLHALQLRAGYRHNLSDVPSNRETGMASVGLGLSLFGVRMDAAVAGNSDEVNAALQLGFGF